MPIALSVAGSDPTGGAGLQLDVQVFRSLGVHGAAVATALTVQDTQRVHRVLPVFPSAVLDQLRVVLRDLPVAAVKIGMLATDDVARSVALGLEELGRRPAPIVLDPVLAASSGLRLLERRAFPTLLAIARRAALVTPNVPELAELSGDDVSSRSALEVAARRWRKEVGLQALLVTGGHLEGPPDDLLVLPGRSAWLPGERVPGGPVHGTGCALSSALAAELARGTELEEAVGRGRAYVHAALERARPAGRGARLLGLP